MLVWMLIRDHILHVCKQLWDYSTCLGVILAYAYHVDGANWVTISLHMTGDPRTTDEV